MITLLTLASLLAAALLFAIQPMAAKMALPLLGGSASVWTVCMLFFQTGLLVGYAWAHQLGRLFGLRTQVILHAVVCVAAIATLPPAIATSSVPPVDASPAPWLLGALVMSFGLPYAALASTGPLLQSWLARTDHPASADPYFLYAAGNVGSFAGLLAYPLILERSLPLRAGAAGASQAGVWSAAFGALVVIVVAAGVWAARRRALDPRLEESTDARPAWSERLTWLLLAFVPSCAVLGVTQYLTSDIAAIPLFWVVPLGLYLLTFVIAFSSGVRLPPRATSIALGVILVCAAAEFREGPHVFGRLVFPLHLAALTLVGLVCHGRLAAVRPGGSRLTEYYLWIALGGCLGGVFNVVVAPFLFDSIAEYPFALALAAFLVSDRAARGEPTRERLVSMSTDIAIAVAVGASVLLVNRLTRTADAGALYAPVLAIGVPSLLTLATIAWPRRFAFALAALLAVTWTASRTPWTALYRERTFYGVHRIVGAKGPELRATGGEGSATRAAQPMHVLIDGVTRHGSQSLDLSGRLVPTTYYHPSGPLGDIVRGMRERGPLAEVALIGLGAGTAAAYGNAGERFTFFEIDPAIARIAKDPRFFTYLMDSRAEALVVVGDGRRLVAACDDARFDLIVLDAFSSDAIPVHLLTREAVALYLRKLKPGGALALHLTNGYLSLDPVVASIAADLGVPAALRQDATMTPQQAYEGKDASTWAIIGRDPTGALPVRESDGWVRTATERNDLSSRFLWTDDRSNLVGLLRRR